MGNGVQEIEALHRNQAIGCKDFLYDTSPLTPNCGQTLVPATKGKQVAIDRASLSHFGPHTAEQTLIRPCQLVLCAS